MANKKLGLVLGGGGAKGYAHIGVLKALEENNIKIDYVAGTSIGALIGALYCLEYTPEEIETIAKTTNLKKLYDFTLSKKGLIKGDKIELYLRHLFKDKKFSELKKPLFVVATDITNFQEVIFNEGDITKAVRASISIPGVFHPTVNDKRILIDGGILDNLPLSALKKTKTESIIAINLYPKKLKPKTYQKATQKSEETKIPNLIETLLNIYTMTNANQIEISTKDSENYLIISPEVKSIKMQDFKKIDEGIQEGYNETKKNIDQIKLLIKKEGILKKISKAFKSKSE